MGEGTEKYIVAKFLGINTEDAPNTLPIGMTDDCLDVYGDGTFVGKRPGIDTALTNSACSSYIYDMVYASPKASGVTAGPKVLFMIYRGTSNDVNVAAYDIYGDALIDIGAVALTAANQTDANGVARLIHGDEEHLMVSPSVTNGTWGLIEHYSATNPWWRDANYAAPDSGKYYSYGINYRQRVFWTGGGNATTLYRATWSDEGDPETYGAASTVDMALHGAVNLPTGFAPGTDCFYWLFENQIYLWSGAIPETFRLEQTDSEYGSCGSRSFALVNGTPMGFVTHSIPVDDSEGPKPAPNNIIVLRGLHAEPIGDPVLSLIRTGSIGYAYLRTETYRGIRSTLFAPDIPYDTSEDSTLLCRDNKSGAWWKWTIKSSVSPSAFVDYNNTVYVGCQDGHVRKFNTATSQDSGTNFNPYFTIRAYPQNRTLSCSVAAVEIVGEQTSGGATSIYAAPNEDSFPGSANATLTLATTPTRQTKRFAKTVKAGNCQRVKIAFPTDGVGCKIYSVIVHLNVTRA